MKTTIPLPTGFDFWLDYALPPWMRVALCLTPCSLTAFQIKTTFVLLQKLSWTHSGQRPLREFKIEQTSHRESFLPTLSLGICLAVRGGSRMVECNAGGTGVRKPGLREINGTRLEGFPVEFNQPHQGVQ